MEKIRFFHYYFHKINNLFARLSGSVFATEMLFILDPFEEFEDHEFNFSNERSFWKFFGEIIKNERL